MKVLTLGTFDLFHEGHVRLLHHCRRIAGQDGKVTVALNTDEFVAAFKVHPPVVPLKDRWAVIAACRYVDWVVVNSQDVKGSSAGNTIGLVRPDVIVVGSDWEHRDYLGQIGVTREFLDARSVDVQFVPYGTGSGSTGIKRRVVELAG